MCSTSWMEVAEGAMSLWREVDCRSESVMIIKVDSGKSVEVLSWQNQVDALVRPSEKEGSSWAAIQKSRVIDKVYCKGV